MRQTFDGGRFMWHTPGLQVDGFVTRPGTTKPGIFDDNTNPNVWFWGVYGGEDYQPP